MSFVLRDCELYWAKLVKPVNPFNAEIPHWEIQIRTRDKAKADEWKAHGLHVVMQEDDNGSFYRVNLKKKAKSRKGEDRPPVRVLDGQLEEIDPGILGNGSVGHVQIDDYEFEMNGKKQKGFSPRGIQVLKLVEYRGAQSPFEIEGETQVVVPTDTDEDDTDW